jgi:hypothetical protein
MGRRAEKPIRRIRASKLDEADLIGRLCHALDIASLVVEHLAPAGFTDLKKSSSNIRREKPIAETGVLLHGAALATHHPAVKVRIHRIAGELAPHARSSQMRLGLALNPASAFDYSIGHILLTRLGYPDATFDALLRQSSAAQVQGSRERMPHRILEQEWLSSLWGQSVNGRSHGSANTARRSILNHPMDVLGASDEDLYAFTHGIMYVNGFKRATGALPRRRALILAEAEAALARCLDAQDYDLSGEILLTWPLTGSRWSPAAAFTFRVLADVEDQAGFLPTPATRVDELKTRHGLDRTLYLLATSYHTVYVMGLLCAAALQPGCTPPAEIPRRRAARGCVQALLPFLEDDKSPPHWRDTFQTLERAQAEALAGMLLNIALQRKAARRDFGGLEQVLRCGYDLGLAGTPAASQAAEMLQRLAIYADSVSV